jgi:predicted XRE-type DNA-binding protein
MPAPQRLDAVFVRLESGSERVREWLKSLRKDERKAIGEDIAYVQFKWPIGKPRVDHLRGPVWEVRTSLTGPRMDTVRGRGPADGAAARIHQEDTADTMPISSWQRNASRGGNVAKRNPRTGSRFDDFLKVEGIFEEVQAKALKRALAEQLQESMQAAKLTKVDMAKKMATSRSQLDRVLDPSNVSVQLDTLIKAARALGKEIEIKIKRATKKEVT